MDLDQLRALQAVARHGTVTAAAAALDMSQSGISRRISRLEDELDTALLDRSGWRAALTGSGERVLAYADDVLSGFEQLRAALASGPRLAGTLRIIASTTPGGYVVPELVSRFAETYADVSVQVFEADSGDVPRLLLEHHWDVGFVGRDPHDPRLTVQVVAEDEVVLIVPAGHRLAGRQEVSVADLRGERLLERHRGSGTRGTVEDALRAAHLRLPAVSTPMRLGSTQAVVAAVDRGLGIGFVTLRAVAAHAAGRVVPLRLAGLDLHRRLYAVARAGRADEPIIAALLELATAGAGTQQ